MKIFSWMHRRFIHIDGFHSTENAKRADHDADDNEILTKECDTQALLEKVDFADMLDGWGGGILAIGTFGLDSINHGDQEKEYHYDHDQFIMDKNEEGFDHQVRVDEYIYCSVEGNEFDRINHDDRDEEEEGEVNPLVCLASNNCYAQIRAKLGMMAINDYKPLICARAADDHDALIHEDSASNKWDCDNVKMVNYKKERITLADLFSAESDHDHGNTKPADPAPTKKQPQSSAKNKKPCSTDDIHDATANYKAKGGRTFPKKLIPDQVKQDHSRPIRKLNQLMKRMLNRKIHPHVEAGKIHKLADIRIPISDDLGLTNLNESVSLLQLQDTPREL